MKRFTETTKWRDPWFRHLSPTAKLLWSYLTDNCDCTGLIDLDIEAASFDIGAEIDQKHLAELESRTQRTKDGKIFVPQFIPFQYGVLSEQCPAHKSIIKSVTERKLITNGKYYLYPSDSLPDRVEATLGVGLDYPTRKEKEREIPSATLSKKPKVRAAKASEPSRPQPKSVPWRKPSDEEWERHREIAKVEKTKLKGILCTGEGAIVISEPAPPPPPAAPPEPEKNEELPF